jgi:hypothetical protein
MNIILKDDHFAVDTVAEDGTYVTLIDTIGFSTADDIEGFNEWDTAWVNTISGAYPKINETALVTVAYKNCFATTTTSSQVKVGSSAPIVRAADDVNTLTYASVAFAPTVSLTDGDGWYTIHLFLLSSLVEATEVYYSNGTSSIIDPTLNGGAGGIISDEDLVNNYSDLSSITLQIFCTPGQERKLNDLIGDATDISLNKGAQSKEFKKALKSTLYVDLMLSGAHVKYNDGMAYLAQQIIEDLENSDPYGE